MKENKKQWWFLPQSLKGSSGYVWDHQPNFDANKQFVRDGVNKHATC